MMEKINRITFLIFIFLFGSCNQVKTEVQDQVGQSNQDEVYNLETTLSVSNITDSTADVAWGSVSNASYYFIIDELSSEVLASVEHPSINVTVKNLTPETNYKIKIKAISDDGATGISSQKESFTTNSKPIAPTGVSVLNISSSTNKSVIENPTVEVEGVKEGDTIKIYSDSSCSTLLDSKESTGNSVEIELSPLSEGVYTFYASATNENADESDCSSSFADYEYVACPNNYVPVPYDANIDVPDFCVMQYSAKAWDDADGDTIVDAGEVVADGCDSCSSGVDWSASTDHLPLSAPENHPWVRVDIETALAKCRALGAGHDLISNPEWMTIARNVDQVGANWSSGVQGVGCMYRGATGDTDEDVCGYGDGTTVYYGTSRNDKSKLTLSTGGEVWDLSGNLYEWVNWERTTSSTITEPPNCTNDSLWHFLTESGNSCLGDSTNYLPADSSILYSRLGKIYYGTGVATRGGFRNQGHNSGIYSMRNSRDGTNTPSVTFRCVYRP